MGLFGGGEGLLAGLKAEQMMGEIAMQPYEQQMKQAQAKQAQIELQKNQTEMQLMQAAKFGAPGGMVEDMEKMAYIKALAGKPDEAAKIMQASYLARQRGAKANLLLTDQLVKEGQVTQQTLDLGGRLFATAHDDDSQHSAARVWRQMRPDAGPLADIMENSPYSPELIEQSQKWGIAMKDQAALAIKTAKEKSDELNRKSLDTHRKAMDAVAKQNAATNAKRADNTNKAGGKSVTAPTPTQISMALRIIQPEFPGVDATTLMQGAGAAASMALKAQKDNPGAIDFDQAVRNAFEEQKRNGDYQSVHVGGMDVPLFGNVGGKAQSTFTRNDTKPTATKDNVLPLPSSKDALIKGQIYKTKKGNLKWNGSELETID